MGKKREYIAHRRESDGMTQCLWEHLKGTAYFAGKFASKIGLEKHGELVGLIHDLGKASFEFYQYIGSATGFIDPDDDEYIDAEGKKGKIDHSSAGAQVIYRYLNIKGKKSLLAMQILTLLIASHHSGLIDCLTPDGKDNYSRRMNKSDKKTRTIESELNLDDTIKKKVSALLSSDSLINDLNQRIVSLCENDDSKESYMLKMGLLVRFLFSCIIDADRLNTADFEFPQRKELKNYGNYVSWSVLIERFNRYLKQLENRAKEDTLHGETSDHCKLVNALRQEISAYCYDFSNQKKSLYQLTVPTGGGKTLSSLRFALNHAEKHCMDRIIYVIPYTSIIDQNADKAREALEDRTKDGVFLNNIVLEHHSNLTPEKENTRQKLLSENWDAPVVFTTMVQFLEALFGYGTRGARRMHQLANAIVIFDEIQTLPVKCVHLFNIAIRFLIKGCGSTVVLCTATQPLLDGVKPEQRALKILPDQQMMPDVQRLFEELKRVEVFDRRKIGGWADHEVVELVRQELHETGSVLIVVNTKKSAVSLFSQLQTNTEVKVFHLSTNMCPAHRLMVLKSVRKILSDNKPIVCVSTQLIEAGVDIDFGSVIRYLAGLDSIAQAAGRCNRNGARPKPGRVFIINPKDEKLDKLKDIKIGRDKAERVLDEYKKNSKQFDDDILGLKAMERYYKYYFYDRKEEMCYIVSSNSGINRSDNLFELLSTNNLSVEAYQRMNNESSPPIVIRQSFMTAAKVFQAIDSYTRGVIVPYGIEGERIITELCAANYLDKQYKLLKEAQRFSINVFPQVFDEMVKQQVIREVQKNTGVFYLDKYHYSDDFGMSESSVKEMDFLNY